MKTFENIPYKPFQSQYQLLDLYLPEGEGFPVFLYFHGGSLEGGDKGDHPFIPYLVSRGVAVVSANYRTYPYAHYPDFIEDAACAVAWTAQNIGAYGGSGKMFVGGSSAGGYLSMMLCFDKKYLGLHGMDPDSMAGWVFDAGQPTTHFNVLRERGADPRQLVCDQASPLYHVKENPNYPPMLVLLAEQDMENRREQTMLLLSTLSHFGCGEKAVLQVIPGSLHTEYNQWLDEKGESVFGALLLPFLQGGNMGKGL